MTMTLRPETGQPCTADTLLSFPSDWHFELMEGRLREMSPAGDAHGAFTYDLGWEIGAFVKARDLGRCYAAETGFLLARDPDTVLAPDFAFVASERAAAPKLRGFVSVVPDLVLETRSPTDRGPAVAEKVRLWLSYGVRLVLDLEPSVRRVTVYRPGAEPVVLGIRDTLEGYDVLPGFYLPLARLFESV